MGRCCWLADVRVSKRGVLMVDVDAPDIGSHQIRLLPVLCVTGVSNDEGKNAELTIGCTQVNKNRHSRNLQLLLGQNDAKETNL